MRSDKEIKKEFLVVASRSPHDYYATQILEKEGFLRKQCTVCNRFFWTTNTQREVCGDSSCQGKIDIFENNPSKTQLTYAQVWETFTQHMRARGYQSIPRYPVVARWNPTTDFTMASIAAFQPYVVAGEVEPPAKKLVIPQFCLRFGDVDNVGITGSHCTGFVMIGQKQFVPPSEWSQNQAFEDLYSYITGVLGIPKEELTLHEDAWAGGGNFGPCMEFFSRGVELCNQVYMLYEQTEDGERELSLKVLDMGLGMERIAWFTQGAPTLYDAAFPKTLSQLQQATGVQPDILLYKKFAPYATLLNLDEVDDINAAWQTVAEKVGVPVEELRNKIDPMRALYSVAEHARALLVALADGALPSNVGGYYNLRVIYRRAQGFIDEHGWDVTLEEVAQWHAQELQDVFPELHDALSEVKKLLGVEHQKYIENKKRSQHIIEQALTKTITTEALLELYDSHGISPDDVRRAAREQEISVVVPENFYALLAERHEGREQKTQTAKRFVKELQDAPATNMLYYKSYDYAECSAIVVATHTDCVVLDRTVFYPTGGGQEHDTGVLIGPDGAEYSVKDVFKQAKTVVHVLENPSSLSVGDQVHARIDFDRRQQLAQHHTAAHIINGAARRVLGDHVWQAGAAKTVEKGRLDITHYEALSDEQLQAIEQVANDLVSEDLPVVKQEMKKSVAEAEHGFRLYQGGAVPGNVIRVIDIPGFDTEACGGTHLNTTGEAEKITLLKSTKIQDGVVRIEFVAGPAATKLSGAREHLLEESMLVLGITNKDLLAPRTEELFAKWKKVKKLRKKGKDIPVELTTLSAEPRPSQDPLQEAAATVSVQEEHLPKTLTRFLEEWRG